MLQITFYATAIYLGVVSLLLIAYVRAIYRRIRSMNASEQTEFAALQTKVSNLIEENKTLKADKDSLTAQVSDLTAKLAAVPADDSAEVVAAVKAIEDQIDAANPPVATPPSDPNTPPAAA